MQEALRLTQTNKGDDRIAMRIVIGLGDITFQENDLIGDMLALVVRIEAITPADEIYLTSSARLALASSEVQTALVDNFLLRGFVEPIPVYRVEQRQRTRIIVDAYVLVSDLRGFTRLTQTQPVGAIEGLLDTLDAMATGLRMSLTARSVSASLSWVIAGLSCSVHAAMRGLSIRCGERRRSPVSTKSTRLLADFIWRQHQTTIYDW